ncbi:putative addiction module antidote protein [Providencia alcalifaciens]|uniref:addiction module antidote protein n=1 Tax=Providencia alcalifaciens TaxID=126385 RepID=UPI001CE0DEFB|nr:addiction module antidote protein [Providencia alcalifaciens]UBX48956.1 putative addiction module antidote protein [Providencia alcalifaciens]
MAKSRLHDDAVVEMLRKDPTLIPIYLQQAFVQIDEDGGQAAFLLALRHIIEARGGMADIAEQSGLSRETLYRTLSPSGNPTLKTLRSIINATGIPFSSLATLSPT